MENGYRDTCKQILPSQKHALPCVMAFMCKLKTKMSALSNLKIWGPFSVSHGIVVFRRKTGEFMFRKLSEKTLSVAKLAKDQRSMVKLTALHPEKRDFRSHFVLQNLDLAKTHSYITHRKLKKNFCLQDPELRQLYERNEQVQKSCHESKHFHK